MVSEKKKWYFEGYWRDGCVNSMYGIRKVKEKNGKILYQQVLYVTMLNLWL